jgi:cellulose biosynthesis protein BcsQ
MNIMAEMPYAKQFRRAIHEAVQRRASPTECLEEAMAVVDQYDVTLLDEPPGLGRRHASASNIGLGRGYS